MREDAMPHAVQFTPDAAAQLRELRAADAAKIADQCHRILSVNPTLQSKARIKRLVGVPFPPYRLRVDDYRVFYDVEEATQTVMIYAVLSKAQAREWLADLQREREHENEDD
jgi:mRNA-degrading endonuclease RelE of RelBE toxin-antitoxin system